ncbi:replicative DNA helicase [Ponticaulis sp.]|uniref:replicative DNA helicase n=1 Tax=Ponticaulis sp. TaxID=2020902 RepID=UPI000B76362C|nr:replicative DNA helicase [Ponticaulis sp.]MAI91947.1 replicative DNA helicase [Ponticaulis sp.]OUX96419.1 MAG: replicative DNA helicase [Hyphomonadaceae bacterium TMED5]|tara:strand:- start:23737 stop:25206 length:1470 start_codon:yes stop_codon:yes gene_type:complete
MAYDDQAPKTKQDSPHNVAAEAAILGAILFDNNAFHRVSELLIETDFYNPAHAEIYAVIAKFVPNGKMADGVTLHDEFAKSGKLEAIGGASYLAELLDLAAFGPEIVDYAHIVRDLAIRRELIDIGAVMVSNAAHPKEDIPGAQQIETAEKKLGNLAMRGSARGGFVTFGSAITQSIESATMAFQRDGKIAGISTGLMDLDNKLGGLHNSDLLILAGRPSMGKTSLATNIAYNAAAGYQYETNEQGQRVLNDGAIVGFFSLEMSSEQLATRILAERSGVQSHRIRQGDLERHEYDKLRDAAAELESLPLFIDDTGGISISQLSARARRQKRSLGLDLLIIDYLQLITGSGAKSAQGRVQEVSEITMGLKALAKELNIPIIALSQLSRQVEQRDDKRPQLSDLRESGSIEQDADAVLFVYRESYYLERQEPDDAGEKFAEWQERMERLRNIAEVIVSKQRHGPIGKVELHFDPNITKFSNLDKRYASSEF